MFCDKITEKVNLRKEKSQYRTRVVRQSLLDNTNAILFSGNDYLGLANHPRVVKAFTQAAERYGIGSTASPMVVGYHTPHRDLEMALADFLGFARVVLFSCGYMANLGVVSGLCDRHDTVFLDRICHASSIDAVQLSGATLKRYRHMDVAHLKEQLQDVSTRKLIISEGIFGMDGDIAKVAELSLLAREVGAGLLIDDAHGIGILGKQGRGVLSHYGLPSSSVDVYLGAFGKAFGAFGAFVAGNENMIDGLMQLARPYMFSTSMPPAIPASVLAGLQVLQEETWRHETLQNNIHYFRKKAAEYALPVLPSITPIQVFMVGDALEAERLGALLKTKGVLVSVIRPPTVPENTSRLRISLNVSHTYQDIDRVCAALGELVRDSVA